MNHTKANASQSRRPFLIVGIIVAVLLIALFLLWLRGISAMPVVSIPTPSWPTPNVYDYFVKAGKAVRDDDGKIGWAIMGAHSGPPENANDHPYSQTEKEALVRENSKALATLRQGFAYTFVSPPVRSYSFVFSVYANDRQLARLLSLESQAKAGRGDWSGAINSNLDAVQLGVMMPHGDVFISSLVGIACEAIGRQPIWRNYSHLNAAQSQAAALQLEAIAKKRAPFADTLMQEKWAGQAELLETFREENAPHDLAQLLLPGSKKYSERLFEAQLLLTPKRRIMKNYTIYMDHVIASARRPYATAPPLPPVPNDPLCKIMLPIYSQVRFKPTVNQTEDALLMTTFALHAYHEASGAYPTALAALVPKYLKAMPSDPFAASGPLQYRRTNTGYLLYSVGPDGKDDNGMVIYNATIPGASHPTSPGWGHIVSASSKGDIVAGVNIN